MCKTTRVPTAHEWPLRRDSQSLGGGCRGAGISRSHRTIGLAVTPALRSWRLQPYRQSLPRQAEPSLLPPADPAEFAKGGTCPPQAAGAARHGKSRAAPGAKLGWPNRQASPLRNGLSVRNALLGNRVQLAQPARRVESAKRSPAITQASIPRHGAVVPLADSARRVASKPATRLERPPSWGLLQSLRDAERVFRHSARGKRPARLIPVISTDRFA